MPDTALHPLIDLRALRLTTALALIEQGTGQAPALPHTADGSERYLQSVIDSLCELSLRDPLTGLANRRHFHAALEREVDRVARSGEAALLLMLDIDHFKRVNDSFGHVAGDKVLQVVAQALSGCVRPMDTLARYGGEEFAIVLPACQAEFGRAVAERIRRVITATPILVGPESELCVTLSIGGAFALQRIRSTPSLWTNRADHQLYRAKSEGRNRVCIEAHPNSIASAEKEGLLFRPLNTDSGWGELPQLDSNDSAY